MNAPGDPQPPPQLEHLTPSVWASISAAHIAKMIAEFAHESIIKPEQTGPEPTYRIPTDKADVSYQFHATSWPLEHWVVAPDSIVRLEGGQATPLSSLQFVVDLAPTLGLQKRALEDYLEEMSGGLYADAYKYFHTRLSAFELAQANFQTVEASMTAGHPCFAVNGGRVGFDVSDHQAYAPESGQAFPLAWVAARRERARFSAIDGLDERGHLASELSARALRSFEEVLESERLEPGAYIFMPVHPWQWFNRLCTALAADIARRDIVFLGYGDACYQPQQSIRTLFNADRPDRCYVKTALGITNMGFMRGLSPEYMEATPAINQWVHAKVTADSTLQACGFRILRELAAVGYRSSVYARGGPQGSPHRKLLAALWRESPVPHLRPGERILTMASLLHIDRDGASVLGALVKSSPVDPEQWLGQYLRVYLRPLLHCFFAHAMVFMPHGENVIVVLKNGVPAGAFMKDIAEEVAVFDDPVSLPQAVRRIAFNVPEELHALSIFTDVFDCFFRFLVPVIAREGIAPECFWRLVAEAIHAYQSEHPELSGRFRRYNLFAPTFARSCLNRLQLCNSRQMLDLDDPAAGLQLHGELANPLAAFGGPAR